MLSGMDFEREYGPIEDDPTEPCSGCELNQQEIQKLVLELRASTDFDEQEKLKRLLTAMQAEQVRHQQEVHQRGND
jgi:hypothetical protein